MKWPVVRKIVDGTEFWQLDPLSWIRRPFHSKFVKLYANKPLKNILETYKTPLVMIRCPDVEQQRQTKQMQNILGTVAVGVNDERRFVHHEFSHLTYHPLNIQALKHMTIQLTDNNGENIGFKQTSSPTIVKLVLRKMNPKHRSQLIRVSSHKTALHPFNSKHSFEVTLPQSLEYHKSSVALLSATFPTTFKNQLSVEERKIFTVITSAQTQSTSSTVLICPDAPRSLQEICESFEHQANLRVKTEVDQKTGALVFKVAANHEMEIRMDSKLFYYLGGNKSLQSPMVLTISGDYKMSQPPRLDHSIPRSLFLCTNLVEETPIADKKQSLLRIVPLLSENTSSYSHFECKHLDHHKVILARPQHFRIDIRLQDGNFAHFNEDENEQIMLDLLFTNYEK